MFCLALGLAATAQTAPREAILSGHVADATGALIPSAHIELLSEGHAPLTTTSDSAGRYSIVISAPGAYTITAVAEGFAPYRSAPTALTTQSRTLDIHLTIAGDVQQVEVAPDTSDQTDPANNGDSTVLKGKAINDLPLDPDQLTQQLNALAGGDSPELRVDGFTGGRMPPRSSIREIRINQNPFSAQNDTNPTNGYIEIFTKPGTQEYHGEFYASGQDSSFNAISPLLPQAPPPYHSWNAYGNFNGPLSKHTSFFFSGQHGSNLSNSIIKAQILDPANNQVPFTQAISNTSSNNGFSARLDASIGSKSTIIARYDLNFSSSNNAGIGNLSLPAQAYNSGNTQQTLQLSNSQIFSKTIVNDTRFQYIRTRNHQTPLSFAPAIVVQGAFNDGGNNTGSFHDNTDRYELQSYTSVAAGKHFINFGGRFRSTRDANSSRANYNGQFVFSSLTSYQQTRQGVAGAGPSQYSVTFGTPSVVVTVSDVGLYVQDDWKATPTLTLSAGLRFEAQNQIADHNDWAPRLAFAYSFGAKKGKPQPYILRGGSGLFYTRFASSNVLQAARQNGISQKQYVINTPSFFSPNFQPTDPSQLNGAVSSSTTFQVGPTFHAPYMLNSTISLQRNFARYGSVTVSYASTRGVHSQITRNINAPEPGTYNPADPTSGKRPLGGTSNIYEYDSQGVYRANRFAVNWFSNLGGGKYFVYGNYNANWQNSDTWGGFPSNSYNLGLDYGRAPTPVNSLNTGFGLQLPFNLRASTFLLVRDGRPFNITTGTDLNGDAQYNDRPSFATDLTRPSVVKTAYGNFDTSPIAGQKIIPINYGMGPGTVSLSGNLSKDFNFGPRAKNQPPPPKPAANGKPAKKPHIERKFDLSFTIYAQNVLNHVNYAPPVGTLSSPLFGTFVTLSNGFGAASGSANREVNIQTAFRF